jgi:cytochrome P450
MSTDTFADYNPYDPEVLKNPYPYYAWMRKQSPVYESPLGSGFWMFTMPGKEETPVYVVTGYQELVYVLENPLLFTSGAKTGPQPPPVVQEELAAGYPLTPTSFNTDPPEHAKKRRLIQRAMSTERVGGRVALIRAIADELIDSFVQDGAADLFRQYCIPFNRTAMFDFIGAPCEDHAQLSAWNHTFEEVCIPGSPPPDEGEAARELVAYQRYFENTLNERRTNPRDDVLSVLATAHPEHQRDMAETVWGLMVLIGAGQGTAAEGLANVLHLLLQEPNRWKLLQDNRELTAAAIEEGLRLEGPVHWMPRRTTREVELGGVTMPAGANVVVGYSAANRDPEAFPNPDQFDVHRAGNGPLGKHMAIGRGVHTCVGAVFARIALRIAVDALLDRIPGLRLSDGFEVSYFPPAPMFRCVAELPVRWDPRP